MKKKIIYFSIIPLVIVVILLVVFRKKETALAVTYEAKKGTFEVLVYTSGQLEAENSEKILLPEALGGRNVRIYEIKIADIIEEGQVVKEGDYIASLDHKAVEEVLTQARLELEESMDQFEDAKMDSNLNLTNNRDQITNLTEQVEEMKIILDESKYESPSVIRKAEMDLERAKRNLEQEKDAYIIRVQQAEARVNRRVINLNQRQQRVKELEEAYKTLDIYATKPGMVIYAKDRFGDKIKTGTTISRWTPVIATLPDLSKMISVTYVNEIDVSKVKVGQKVTLGIDAFPDKKLEGEVISVANIGQPLPKSDAKVFQVRIRVFGSDPDLRPAMTSSNIIQTGIYAEQLYIPSDAVYSNDSLTYVYMGEKNIVKQVIEPGDENENFTIVKNGLQPGDKVLLTRPVDDKEIPFSGLDIYFQMKEKEESKKATTE